MSEHLVRWRFEGNSLLNPEDVPTQWYKQFHPNKDAALTHYIRLLQSDVEGIEAEIFRLTKLKK